MENKQEILELLHQVADGKTSPDEAFLQLKEEPFENLGYAKVDFHRSVRQGAQEVIYGAGKTAEQIEGIVKAMGEKGCRNILITRLDREKKEALEGALASVVGGLVDCPVVAVPTSVGYGASFGGLSALLSMLNSCASGCSVVNIDNGFGAGYLASRINQMEGLEERK